MTHLQFDIIDAVAEARAASPTIRLLVRVREVDQAVDTLADGPRVFAQIARIDAIAMRVRVQIDPARRAYSENEKFLFGQLFGPRERWAHSVRPMQWADVGITVGRFTGETIFDVPIPCSYDLQVASGKYLSGLEDGTIPIRLFFNGTVFRGGENNFAVEMLAWDIDCTGSIPVSVWQDAMRACFGDQAWISIDRSLFDELRCRQIEGNFLDMESALRSILEAQVGERS